MRYVIAVAAVLASGSAWAGNRPMPEYDVDKFCAHVGGVSPADCIEQEQQAYDSAKIFWQDFENEDVDFCENDVRHNTTGALFNPHPYSLLFTCLRARVSQRTPEKPYHFVK